MEGKIIQKPALVVAIDVGSTYTGYAWQWRSDFLNNRSNVEFNTNWEGGGVQKIIQKPTLVVAIDVGSTYTGYAWQWRSDFLNNRSNVEFNTNWEGGGVQLHKTTTCILLKEKDGCSDVYNIEAFGQEAEEIYKTTCKESENGIAPDNLYFFKRFKHLLYSKRFDEDIAAEDQTGKPMKLAVVMSKLIQALKDHFILNLKEKGQEVDIHKTLWVITVPAIWSDKAKQFMRIAAEMSGINEKNILLALEPEAAAVYCIHLPSEQKASMNNLGTPGQVFLTADLGGLTADLYAAKVKEDGTLEEICIAQGEVAGGQNVNDAFFQVCQDSFKGTAWKKIFQKATPIEMMDMEDKFEQQKVKIGSSRQRDQHIALEVPYNMRQEIKNQSITVKQSSGADSQFTLKNDTISFKSSFIKNTLFKEACSAICTIILKELTKEELRECKTLVLVGGFAESPIVVGYIRDIIGKSFPNIRVVVPTSPFRAVLKGAVLFGHDPMIFRNRISRFTYGVGSNTLFDEKKHDAEKKFLNPEDNKYYCKDFFSVHVTKGQSVTLNEQQEQHTYQPMYEDQKTVNLPIYASTIVPVKDDGDENPENVMYTTDEGCEKIGEVVVQMPDTTGGRNRNVLVRMVYGGTELSVVAKDETSGNEASAKMRFSNK